MVLQANKSLYIQSGRGNKPNATRKLTEEEQRSSLKPGSSVTTTRLSSGFFPYILAFEPVTSQESCAGKMYCLRKILKRVENSSNGERREAQEHVGKEALKLSTKKLFATGDARCPVNLYKTFEKHRPVEKKKP